MFSLTTKQFRRLLRNIKRGHIHDYYSWIKRNKDASFSLRFLPYLFGKSVSATHVALHRMKKVFPYPITLEEDDVICVKEEGVRWLYENYFKRDYLKELEEYKWELEKIM